MVRPPVRVRVSRNTIRRASALPVALMVLITRDRVPMWRRHSLRRSRPDCCARGGCCRVVGAVAKGQFAHNARSIGAQSIGAF